MILSKLRDQASETLRENTQVPARYGTAFHLRPPYSDVREIPQEKFTPRTAFASPTLDEGDNAIVHKFVSGDVYAAWQVTHADHGEHHVFRVPAGSTQTLHLAGSGWVSQLYVVVVEAGANLTIMDSLEALTFGMRRLVIIQYTESTVTFWGVRVGLEFLTERLVVYIQGAGATTHITHLGLQRAQQQIDLNVNVYHDSPDTQSRVTARFVAADQATTMYRGLIAVAPNAARTHGYQQGRALLLSPKAIVDMLPELKINTNNVKCSHGVTTTHLDDAALLYLRSRGLNVSAAAALAVTGFFHQDLDVPKATATSLQQATEQLSL